MKVILIVLFVNLLIAINKGDAQNGVEKDTRGVDEAEQEGQKFLKDQIVKNMPQEQRDGHHNKGKSGTNNIAFEYECKTVNEEYCPVERLVFKASFPITNFNCDQVNNTGFNIDYEAYDQDLKRRILSVNYVDQSMYITTIIIKGGSKSHYDIGYVVGDLCKNAVVQVTDYSPNPNPEACNTKKGVTSLDTSIAELTIIGCGKSNIACFGKGHQTFTPGLRST